MQLESLLMSLSLKSFEQFFPYFMIKRCLSSILETFFLLGCIFSTWNLLLSVFFLLRGLNYWYFTHTLNPPDSCFYYYELISSLFPSYLFVTLLLRILVERSLFKLVIYFYHLVYPMGFKKFGLPESESRWNSFCSSFLGYKWCSIDFKVTFDYLCLNILFWSTLKLQLLVPI